jgi:hypothetical protein
MPWTPRATYVVAARLAPDKPTPTTRCAKQFPDDPGRFDTTFTDTGAVRLRTSSTPPGPPSSLHLYGRRCQRDALDPDGNAYLASFVPPTPGPPDNPGDSGFATRA